MARSQKQMDRAVNALAGYAEHDRVAAVKDKSAAIGEFLEWLAEQGVALARSHEHDDGCYTEEGRVGCGYSKAELAYDHMSIEKRLALYFDIDLNKLELEKRAMLAQLKERQK